MADSLLYLYENTAAAINTMDVQTAAILIFDKALFNLTTHEYYTCIIPCISLNVNNYSKDISIYNKEYSSLSKKWQ